MIKIKDTSFTREDIVTIYHKWVSKAEIAVINKEYNTALRNIAISARWMYNFNIIYTDERLENQIRDIANGLFKNTINYIPNADCVVFLDSIGSPNCLDLQYLRGLIHLKKRIIYILHHDLTQCDEIVKTLNCYGNAEIHLIESKYSDVKTAMIINKIIIDSIPSKILLHMIPQDAVSLLAISNIKTPEIFNIDLQDHTFWLGSSFIDFNIQFRSYGEVISLEKRNIKESQIIRLPYYPLTLRDIPFEGFPELPNDSIIIFTGGAQYKMLGKNDSFFRLMDIVLDCSNKVHVLVATIGDNILFSQKLSQLKNRNRIHLLGMRRDINEVFKHSDIFLSTYPFIGGLMTQYAAANALPILSYGEEMEANLVEEMVNHKYKAVKTNYTIDSFKNYAIRLILDKDFRLKEGQRNKGAMISDEDFASYLDKAISKHNTGIKWTHWVTPNYEGMIQYYINNENYNIHPGLKSMISYLKFKVFFYFPKESITIIQCVIRWIKTRRLRK